MRDNITKVAERGERLDQLQDKTGRFIILLSGRDNTGAALVGLFGVGEKLDLLIHYYR